jgi:hypothetical protein
MTAEQYAHDLVNVLVTQRNDALRVASLALRELSRREGLSQCDVCGVAYKRTGTRQRFCGETCRNRHHYVTYHKREANQRRRACSQERQT